MSQQQVIWKFPFKLAGRTEVLMPDGAKLLHVAQSNELGRGGDLCVWAQVWPDFPKVRRVLRVFGTGQLGVPSRPDARYVGTVHIDGFVWHVFDEGELR